MKAIFEKHFVVIVLMDDDVVKHMVDLKLYGLQIPVVMLLGACMVTS